jgi:hypothetical protein
MKNNFYVLFWCIISLSVRAQTLSPTILNSSGGTTTVNGINYEYSFGEMTVISTFSSPKLIVTQGLLQTRVDTIAAGIRANELPVPTITVYPNPAQQLICFESEYTAAGKLYYELVDAAGKLITSKQLTVTAGKIKETIDIAKLPAGMYLLNIAVQQDKVTFFQHSKIQKTE